MTRDIALLRDILLQVRERPEPLRSLDPRIEGRDELTVSYHVMLLHQAGLIEGDDRSALGIFRWTARTLTWAGHELADLMADAALWHRAQAALAANPALNVEALQRLMTAWAVEASAGQPVAGV